MLIETENLTNSTGRIIIVVINRFGGKRNEIYKG